MAPNTVRNLSNLLCRVQFNGNIRSDGTNSAGKSIVSSHASLSHLGSDVIADNGDNTNNKKRSIVSSHALSSRLGSNAWTGNGYNNNIKKRSIKI